MTLLGHGVDVVQVQRIAQLIQRRGAQAFASRILSSDELVDWKTCSNQVQFLAVRWAMKEAAYKALYPHFRPTWKDLTYRGLDKVTGARPVLEYKESIKLHSSVSHDGEYVFASVIVERPD
ncbi:4'-phosphopantetheinyl transferase, partial [Mycena floridula]